MKFTGTITFKVLSLVVMSIVIVGTSVVISTYFSVTIGLDKEFKSVLSTYRHAIDDSLQKQHEYYAGVSASQAIRPNVIKGVADKNSALLKRFGEELIKAGQAEFVVFTDAAGKVLARGHSDELGDDISAQECVRSALAGSPCSLIESGKVVKISLRASAPVKFEGKVIGAVVTGLNITGSNKFVDGIKDIFNVEGTIFYGNIRESTTIIVDGKRVVGTAINRPEILTNVLEKGLEETIPVTLFNKSYLATYWPLKGSAGKPIGMLFIGKDMTSVNRVKWDIFLNIFLICFAATVLLCVASYYVAVRITKPIVGLLSYSKAVEAGDYSQPIQRISNDEAGHLTDSVKAMVQTLKNKLGFSDGVVKGIAPPTVIVDPKGCLTFVNNAMLQLVDKPGTPEDYFGQDLAGFFYGDPRKDTICNRTMREKRAFDGVDAELTIHNGKKRFLRIFTSPIYDLDHALIGSIATIIDMTEAKERQHSCELQSVKIIKAASVADSVSNQVSVAAEQLSAQIEQSTRGTRHQAVRIAEAATAMEEMGATVVEVARNASQAAETSVITKQKAAQGANIVGHVVDGITKARNQAHELKTDMGELGGQALEIGKVMKVILDIADQTNLLALNAAIEAARAGDAGRGFAVVADEVRKLAEKTMGATHEVSRAISGIQETTKRNIENVDQTVLLIEESTTLASQSGEALSEIVGLADHSSDQVRSIATAAEQQSSAIEEINQSIGEINVVASETSQAMDQASRAVHAMMVQSQGLRSLIVEMQENESS